MIEYQSFVPDSGNPPEAVRSAAMLASWIRSEPSAVSRQVILKRLAGNTARQCRDVYFIATDNGECVSRLWYGWGKHRDSIGNFGHFNTREDHRKEGIGGELVKRCFADMEQRRELPLCLFCTSSKPYLVQLYGRHGFRPALRGTDCGYLYCPLGESPGSFQEFCLQYYQPRGNWRLLPGTLEYRHEIDCLLRFALADAGEEKFGWPDMQNYESAWASCSADPSNGLLNVIADESGHIFGWAYTPHGGQRRLQVHPRFRSDLGSLY